MCHALMFGIISAYGRQFGNDEDYGFFLLSDGNDRDFARIFMLICFLSMCIDRYMAEEDKRDFKGADTKGLEPYKGSTRTVSKSAEAFTKGSGKAISKVASNDDLRPSDR